MAEKTEGALGAATAAPAVSLLAAVGIAAIVGVLVGGAIGWSSNRPTNALIQQLLVAVNGRILTEPGDSPVRVVGGSINAHAPVSWDCFPGVNGGPAGNCQQNANPPYLGPGPYQSHTSALLTQLALLGVTAEDSADEPVAWGNLTDNWVVEIFARNPNSSTDGIEICSALVTDSNNKNVNCSGAGTLQATSGLVYLKGKKSNSVFYVAPGPDDDSAGNFGKRFHDTDTTGCAMSSSDQDLCEHMGKIVVTIGGVVHKYHCPDGACKIEIGH